MCCYSRGTLLRHAQSLQLLKSRGPPPFLPRTRGGCIFTNVRFCSIDSFACNFLLTKLYVTWDELGQHLRMREDDIRKVPLYMALRRGIAAHHAGLDKRYRQAVEKLFRLKKVRVVIATSTLAVGISILYFPLGAMEIDCFLFFESYHTCRVSLSFLPEIHPISTQ
jgi:hypothetical protein